MMKKTLMMSALAITLSLSTGFILAADQEPAKEKAQAQQTEQEKIHGSQLMTRKERSEHRAKLRAAKTPEEREKIRKEQHERMKERAEKRGVTLPDEPPAQGSGMGSGGGMGGGGMGPGGMRNR